MTSGDFNSGDFKSVSLSQNELAGEVRIMSEEQKDQILGSNALKNDSVLNSSELNGGEIDGGEIDGGEMPIAENCKDLLLGTVKWFNDAKGFGFLQHIDGRDVFVHFSVIETEGFKTLKDGEEVRYSIKEGPKGLHAARVVRSEKYVKKAKEQAEARRVSLASKIEKTIEESNSQEDLSDEDNSSDNSNIEL